LTHGPSGPDRRMSGPRGWPTSTTHWPACQGLRRFSPSLGFHASIQGGEARVSGGRSTRSAGHVACPAGHHLEPNRHLQVGGGPIQPYKYPLMVKVNMPHSFCNPPLVTFQFSSSSAGEALSGVESWVKSLLELWK
jgi:hypothetical protein